MMQTVRFSKIVEAAGKPVIHVLWTDPAKDPILKKAIDANRVMTVHQPARHEKADYGNIGFHKDVSGQILIFPKSLRRFVDKQVIGIKYDLLEWPDVPKSQQAQKPLPARRSVSSKSRKDTHVPAAAERSPAEETPRMLKFPIPEDDRRDDSNQQIKKIKDQVRLAMDALEEGKQVAAFNLLKRIIES